MWKPSKITGLSEKPCNLQMCLIEVKSGDSRLDGRLINSCSRKGGVVTEELPSPPQFLLRVLPHQKPAHIHGFSDYKMKREGSLLPALPPPPPTVIPSQVTPEKLDAPQRSGSPSDGSPSEPSERSKRAAKIPLESFSLTLHFQDAPRLLDIILRQQAANRVCILAAQSFLCDNSRNLTDVGGGVAGCAELIYSFHPPHGGLSLYMDVTKTVILTPGGEVNFLIVNQNIQDESYVDWDKVKVMLNMRVQTMPNKMEFKIMGLTEKPCNLQMFLIEVKSGDSRLDGGLINCCRRKGVIIEVTEELPSISVSSKQKPADIHGFADYKMKREGSLLPALPPPPLTVIPSQVTPEKLDAPLRSGSPSDGSPSEPSKMSKRAVKIPLESVSLTLHVQDALLVLDNRLRQQAANRVCVLAAQSFFCDNSRNLTDVGGGVTGCAELIYSFHPPHGGLSLYMDVTKTVILTPGGEVNFLIVNQNIQDESYVDWDKVKVMLNMRVQTMPDKMEFKIIGLSEKPCNLQMFLIEVKRGDSRLDGGLINCCRRKGVIIEATEELTSISVSSKQKPAADIHGFADYKMKREGSLLSALPPPPLTVIPSHVKPEKVHAPHAQAANSVGSRCNMGPRKDPIKGGFNFFGLMGGGVVAVGCYVVRGGAGAWSAVADLRRLRSNAEPNFRLHGQFGLNNLGASCYGNAAFQAFISIDSLKREILSIERSGVRLGRMTKVLREILYPRDRNTAVVDTAPIFNVFRGAKRNEVDSPSKFFDEMMQEIYREHPTVAELFGGRRESRRKFDCEYKTRRVKTFKYIYLQGLAGIHDSLSANLHNLFKDSGYIFDKFCDRCRRKHKCNILWKLIDPPQILIVETKFSDPDFNNRMSFDESLSLKSSIFISKPRRVPRGAMEQNEMWNNPPVMGGYPPRRDAPSADASVRYQLKAVVHCTLEVEGNHFIAYVRRVVTLEDGRREVWWLKADDHLVTRTTMDEVLDLDTPVYFFYELIRE